VLLNYSGLPLAHLQAPVGASGEMNYQAMGRPECTQADVRSFR